METRHTLHRTLRSGGTAPRQQLVRERGRSRSAKLPVGKIREKGADGDKPEDVEESSTTAAPSEATAKSSIPQNKKTQSDARPVGSREMSKSPMNKRTKVDDRTPGLTLRGRSIHSLKSRVDWSRNAELSPEEPAKASAASEEDQASPTSSVSLRSKSTNSPSQSPAAKILDAPSTAAGRLKSVRQMSAGRSKQNSPSHSPIARLKNSPSGRTSPLIQNDSTQSESNAASTVKVQTTEQVKRQGRPTGRSSMLTDNAAVGTSPVRKLAKASTRSNSAPRPVETDNEPTEMDKLVNRQMNELRSTPPARRLRTNSSSPVTRTRPGAQRGRLLRPNLEKIDDKNVKDLSTPDPVANSETTDLGAAGDEEVEGDADSVTRPPVCSSSSPESDHNYAKAEVADEPSSSKVAVVGKPCGNEGPLSEAGLGGDETGVKDGLETVVGGDGFKAKRVLRGHFRYRDTSKQTTVKEVMEPCPKVSSGKGFIDEEALHGKDAVAGKVIALQRLAVDPSMADDQKMFFEKETKARRLSPLKALRGTKRLGPPSSKVRKPLLQSLRQRKSNSKYMLQMIKSTLSKESNSSEDKLQAKQSQTKDKAFTKIEKPDDDDDDDVLPALTDVKLPRTSFSGGKPRRNLFEQFSTKSVSTSHDSASFPAVGSQDVALSVMKEKDKEPKSESTESAFVRSDNSSTFNNNHPRQGETNGDQSRKVKLNRTQTNKQQASKQTRSKIDTKDATHSCINPDTEKFPNGNLKNTNPTDRKADPNSTEKARTSRRLSMHGRKQKSEAILQRNAILNCEYAESQHCTSTPISNGCEQTDTMITQMQLGTLKNTNEGGEGLASLGLCVSNDASKSSLGYQDTFHQLEGPVREPVTVSDDGRDGKSEVKLGTRKLRGLKPRDSPAETPIHSHLTTKSSLYRRPQQKADKSVSQGPGGETEAPRDDGDSTHDVPHIDVEGHPPAGRTRAGRSGRTRPMTTGSLPITDLNDLSVADKVNKHTRRSSIRKQSKVVQNIETPTLSSEPVVKNAENSMVTPVVDVKKTRKGTAKNTETEESGEKLDTVTEPDTQNATDSVISEALVAPEPAIVISTELTKEKNTDLEPVVTEPVVKESAPPAPVVQEKRRRGRPVQTKVDVKRSEFESAIHSTTEDTPHPEPVVQEKRRRGRPTVPKAEVKKIEVGAPVEPVADEAPHQDQVIHEKRRPGRTALPKAIEESKTEVEPAEVSVTEETSQLEPTVQEKKRTGRYAVPLASEEKTIEPAVEPEVEETALSDPVIHEKKRPGRRTIPKVGEEKKIEIEATIEPITEEATQAEPMIQEKKQLVPTASEEKKLEPAVAPFTEETGEPEVQSQEKRQPGKDTVSTPNEDKKTEVEHQVETVTPPQDAEKALLPTDRKEKTIEVVPPVESVIEDTSQPVLLVPEKRRPGRPAKRRRLKSVHKQASSDSESHKEKPGDMDIVADCKDVSEPVSDVTTDNDDQSKKVDMHDSVPSKGEPEEVPGKKDKELLLEATVDGATNKTVPEEKSNNLAINSQVEQVSQDTVVPQAVKRGRGRPKKIQPLTTVVCETAAQVSLQVEPLNEDTSGRDLSMNEQLNSLTDESEVLKDEVKSQEETVKMNMVETKVVADTDEQNSGDDLLVPQVDQKEEVAVELKASTANEVPEQKKRGRGRPYKHTVTGEVEVTKSPAAKEVSKDVSIRPAPRWKIPPPSPIRTRRLSKETVHSRRKIALTGIAEVSKERVQVAGEESVEQGSQDATNEVQTTADNSAVLAQPEPETLPNDQVTHAGELEQAKNNDSTVLETDFTIPPAPSAQVNSAKNVIQDINSAAVDVERIELEVTKDSQDLLKPSTGASTGPVDSLPVVSENVTDSSATHDASDTPNTPEQHKVLTETAESTPTTAVVPEQNTPPTTAILQTVSEPFTSVDELQVPFHDTDEAELSEILSQKDREATTEEPDEGDGLKLYLEVESNQSDETKELAAYGAQEITIDAEEQPNQEGLTAPKKLLPPSDNEPSVSAVSGKQDQDSQHLDSVKEVLESCAQKEDTEVESIFAKGNEDLIDSSVKEGNGHPTDTSIENSPSKSEWSARKVKTGMKIVLKLKRKGSSERSENNSPSTPLLADPKPSSSVSPSVNDMKGVKGDAVGPTLEMPLSIVTAEAKQNTPSVPIAEVSPGNEEMRRRRKRRRNELEMLSVIDRAKRKNDDDNTSATSAKMNDSDFTSDSTLATQSSTTEKQSTLTFLDVQDDVKIEPKEEIKVETPVTSLSNVTESNEVDQKKPKVEDLSKMEPHQKVEKLVIKRRVPSPTKMKTRGKQNRLWYLFAKQSKPSKEFVIPPVYKEHKAAPTGTMQELKALCKPCSVSLVDISFIMDCRENMPGETSVPQSLDDQVDSTSDVDDEPPTIEGRPCPPCPPDSCQNQTLDIPHDSQGVKRKPSPIYVGQQTWSDAKAVDIPLSHEESTPISKKPRLQAGSDYETQYLSFVMKNSAPYPVLDKSVLKTNIPSEGATKSHAPKPVLTRAPVTARKSMKSAKYTGVGNQSREASPIKATNLTKGSGGLHQDVGQSPPGMSSPGKFACLYCPYTSNVRSVMLEHVYIHTDFVPYACGHCSEAYGSRNGVVIHTKREHPGMIADIVKNTEICEEDYYITCDTNKRTSDPVQQSEAGSHNSLSVGLETSPSACTTTSVCSSGKSVSLLNPAVLTAQVAATKVGLAATHVTSAPVQLVVSTSRPTSTAPIVNVVGQVDPSVSGLQVLAPIKAVQGKEHSVIGVSEGGKKSSRRPRIPLLVNVDPSQPYYQCRHCTFANNNLGSIRTHVETQHKGEQRYQCHRCELVFFKNSMTMEKHYAKLHPGEPVSYALQADFYDVHQDGGDKAKTIHDSATGLQNRGQSPLHVIVSPDGVTLLGATEVSPAASMASPQMSPSMAHTLTSPGPAHCKPHPVLSPPSLYPPGQGPTPPPAHSGSSPALSPHSQPYSKPGPACSKSSRVILKVPTISPPQRSVTQTHHTKFAAPQVAVPQVASHDHSKPLLQSPISSTHSPASGTSNEAVNILNLTTTSSCPSPGLDLSKKLEAEPASAAGDPAIMDLDTSLEVISPSKQMVADESHPEVTETEMVVSQPKSDVAMPSADDTHDIHSVGPSDSPPPLMIMNVMSLAGQTDCELHPDECVASIDTMEPSQKSEAHPDGAETYTCTTCDAAFTELDSVISHVGEVHKLQYWYSCPYCPFGCSRSRMLQHICRAHSDQPANVPINIIDEEKYFIRHQISPKLSESKLNSQSSAHSQADVDEELDIESEQAKEKVDTTQSPDATNVTVEEKVSEQTSDGVTAPIPEPKTSEKGCSTDDIPCKQPPAPSRVVQLDEEDVVIVAEHRKQRPVGQIRPTMVRAPSAVQGFRRLGSSGNFQQQVQAVSPITVKPTVTDLDMDCENVAEQPRHEEVTEDDDIIVTETQSSVISIPPMDQPLDLHQPKQSPSAVFDEPTDLSVSRSSSRQSTVDEPQDLSRTAHNLSKGPTNLSRSSGSSPSVIKSPAIQPGPGGSRESSVIHSPPPAHQSAQRSVPPLVIEPIPSLSGSRHNQPWGTPILIAPLPQTSSKDSHAGTKQPRPAHTHNQSPRGSVLSAHAGAPNLPSSHRPMTSLSHKGANNNAAHKSSAPHRPVSKTMPPLIHISSQCEKGNSKPLVSVGASQGTVKSAKNSSSVIQPLPSSSHQSALTSLEQMTKRSGSDLGKRPHLSKKLVDNQFADEEAARKAYSVFNLKPKMHHTIKSATVGNAKSTQQTFGAMGINKWQQFQSQNRPQVRPQPQKAPHPSFPGPQPGSLGMAAAAFQQAHMRRSGVNQTQVAGLPQMSSATAAAAAASFMQRQPSPGSNQGFNTATKTPPIIQCPYCQFTAEDADTIHDHILSHAPNIQWSCPYCPLPNRMTKASVTKHMQNCHPKSNLVYIPYGVPLM